MSPCTDRTLLTAAGIAVVCALSAPPALAIGAAPPTTFTLEPRVAGDYRAGVYPAVRPARNGEVRTVIYDAKVSGSRQLTFKQPVVKEGGADFQITANTCLGVIAAGRQCSVTFQFTAPASGSGTRKGSFLLESDVAGVWATANLELIVHGAGQPALSLLQAPQQPKHQFYAPYNKANPVSTPVCELFPVRNDGEGNLTLSRVGVPTKKPNTYQPPLCASADFDYTHDCSNVPPGGTCTISAKYTARQLCNRGYFAVESNAANGELRDFSLYVVPSYNPKYTYQPPVCAAK